MFAAQARDLLQSKSPERVTSVVEVGCKTSMWSGFPQCWYQDFCLTPSFAVAGNFCFFGSHEPRAFTTKQKKEKPEEYSRDYPRLKLSTKKLQWKREKDLHSAWPPNGSGGIYLLKKFKALLQMRLLTWSLMGWNSCHTGCQSSQLWGPMGCIQIICMQSFWKYSSHNLQCPNPWWFT